VVFEIADAIAGMWREAGAHLDLILGLAARRQSPFIRVRPSARIPKLKTRIQNPDELIRPRPSTAARQPHQKTDRARRGNPRNPHQLVAGTRSLTNGLPPGHFLENKTGAAGLAGCLGRGATVLEGLTETRQACQKEEVGLEGDRRLSGQPQRLRDFGQEG